MTPHFSATEVFLSSQRHGKPLEHNSHLKSLSGEGLP